MVYLLTTLLKNNSGQYCFWLENTFVIFFWRIHLELEWKFKLNLNLNNFIKSKFASILFLVSVN